MVTEASELKNVFLRYQKHDPICLCLTYAQRPPGQRDHFFKNRKKKEEEEEQQQEQQQQQQQEQQQQQRQATTTTTITMTITITITTATTITTTTGLFTIIKLNKLKQPLKILLDSRCKSLSSNQYVDVKSFGPSLPAKPLF